MISGKLKDIEMVVNGRSQKANSIMKEKSGKTENQDKNA